jgi:hypothetical protein
VAPSLIGNTNVVEAEEAVVDAPDCLSTTIDLLVAGFLLSTEHENQRRVLVPPVYLTEALTNDTWGDCPR